MFEFRKKYLNSSSFNHSYKINWSKVEFDEYEDFERTIFRMIDAMNFEGIINPMDYKKNINDMNNRFFKYNLNSIIEIGKNNHILKNHIIAATDFFRNFKTIDKNNWLYTHDNNEKKQIYELYNSFENAYWNILDLSKDEYTEYLKEHPHLKENWFKYFKEIMNVSNDVSSAFFWFNIFEFPTTVFEMIEVVDLIKDKDFFQDYFNLILENKNIDLNNLLELISIYNKDDISKNKEFFDFKTVWKLIDNKKLNDDCLEFLPDMLKDFDLKLSKDGVNHIHNSMEKIFLIEDLTLEKYKVLEKAFNLDSLDNSLFDMTKVPNKSLDYYKKIEIGNYFYLTYLDDYQLDSIDDEEYKLDDNTYKILNFVINNTNKNFEISHREMIKAMSLGEEYISLVNNKELFNYIFEKYEKTINKEAMLVVFGHIIHDGIKETDNLLNKYNNDVTNYNKVINQRLFSLISNDLFLEVDVYKNELFSSMYYSQRLIDLNNKLKVKIDDNVINNVMENVKKYIKDFEGIIDYNIEFNRTLSFYKKIEFDRLNEVTEVILNHYGKDSINEYTKLLIENNNVVDLEIFEKITNDSEIKMQNSDNKPIERKKRF